MTIFELPETEIFVDSERYKSLVASCVHIFRNAVDHGIEDPADREMMGKPSQASIGMSFERKDDFVVIHVKDDGQGIDPEKISGYANRNRAGPTRCFAFRPHD